MPTRLPNSRIALAGSVDDDEPSSGLGALGPAFGTLGAMMRIKEQQDVMRQRQQQRAAQQREYEDDQAIRSTLPRYDRPDDAIDDLYKQGRATAAAKLGKSIYDERKAKAAAYDAQLVSGGKRLTQAGQIAQGVVDDATYRPARAALVDLLKPLYGEGINDVLPTTYDAKQMKALIAAGTARAQQITAEHNAAQELMAGFEKGAAANPYQAGGALARPDVEAGAKWSKAALDVQASHKKGLSLVLPLARDKAQWDGYLDTFRSQGASEDTLKQIPVWDDKNPDASRKAAAEMNVTPKEKADIAHQKEVEVQARRRNDIAASRAAQAGRTGGTTGRGTAITATGAKETRERRNKENADVDELYRGGTSSTSALTFENPEDKAEYVARRLQIQNDYRDAFDKPSMDEAAQQAVDDGDREAYDEIAKEYTRASRGYKTLDSVVPWKASTKPKKEPTTPAERRAAIDTARKGLSTTTDYEEQKRLRAEIQRLMTPR